MAELDPGDLGEHRLHQPPVDESLDEQARAGRADLALVGERGEEGAVDGGVEARVGEDDVRVLAAELERDVLDVDRGGLEDGAPRGGAAGEGDLVDEAAQGDLLARAGAGPGDHVHHARGEAGLDGHPPELERRERGELRGLEDAGVAGGEGGRELPSGHQERVVPRDDLAADADRLADDEARGGGGDAHGLAIDLGGEAAVEVEAGGGVVDVEPRLAERLAAAPHLELGEGARLAADARGEIEEEPRPLLCRGPAPGPVVEGVAGGADRARRLLPAGLGHGGEHLAVRRIAYLTDRRGRDPLAPDEHRPVLHAFHRASLGADGSIREAGACSSRRRFSPGAHRRQPARARPHAILARPHAILARPHAILARPHAILARPHAILARPHAILTAPGASRRRRARGGSGGCRSDLRRAFKRAAPASSASRRERRLAPGAVRM